ncbi:MAG: hypothetical protein QOD03_413 [Verrucomicrobiota bacterium]
MCFPRLAFWPARSLPIWYLEATLFLGGFVLWAFVFAWHAQYTNRPVFTVKWSVGLFVTTTLAGILAAMGLHLFLDPSLRLAKPEDYPANLKEWIAMTLFSLALTELFLVFAPFAWLIRLSRNQWFSASLTVLLGVIVLALRNHSAPVAPSLFATLLLLRVISGCVTVVIYLRGGILLVWWWTLLIEARHLLIL